MLLVSLIGSDKMTTRPHTKPRVQTEQTSKTVNDTTYEFSPAYPIRPSHSAVCEVVIVRRERDPTVEPTLF